MKPTLSLAPNPAKELARYLEVNPSEAEALQPLQAYLGTVKAAQALSRDSRPGHVLSTALVLDKSQQRVLLVLHRATGAWQPPGGHYEGTGSLSASALREAEEESGITGLRTFKLPGGSNLIDIKTISFPGNSARGESAHSHHDFMYLFQAAGATELVAQDAEVLCAKWVLRDEFRAMPNPRFARLMDKVDALLAATPALAGTPARHAPDEDGPTAPRDNAASTEDLDALFEDEASSTDTDFPLTAEDLADLAMFK